MVDRRVYDRLHCIDDGAVCTMVFRVPNNAVHHLDSFDRILADRAFLTEHDRVGAVVYRGCHVGGLSTSGLGSVCHRVEHLGCDDNGFRREAAGADQLFLAAGYLFGRDLDTEIAAGDHDRIAERHDIVDHLQGGRFFDFRDDAGLIADNLTCFQDVGWALDEGKREPVNAELQAEIQVGAVFVRQRRKVQDGVRDVDAFAISEVAADADFGDDRVTVEAGYFQLQAPVIDKQAMARGRGFKYFWVVKGDGVAPAIFAGWHEADRFAGLQGDAAVLDRANADFRALKVLQDADRAGDFLFKFADDAVHASMIFLSAVTEV